MQTSESLNNFTILFFRSLTSQLRNMQTACQMVICWLSLWWWRRRMKPVGLLVLSHHRHWTSMTMKTSPLSSVILQKHTTRVIAESGRSLLSQILEAITGRLLISFKVWTRENVFSLFVMCVSLRCRRSTSLPRGSQWQAAYQWDLQVQCGQAVWHTFHRVSVHEWLHGAEAILRSVRLMFLHVIQLMSELLGKS